MSTVAEIARAVLAVIFTVAAVAKLLDRRGTWNTMLAFGVPPRLARPAAIALPIAELAVAFALILNQSARWGGVGALVLLLAFIAGISNVLARGRKPNCNCFGQIASAPVSWKTLARNSALVVLGVFVVARSSEGSLLGWSGGRYAAEVIALVAALIIVGAAMVARQMWRENQSLRTSLARIRREVGLLPSGLPVGLRAPRFELNDARGEDVTLESLRRRGKPVLLLFISPDCGPCIRLLPELTRWRIALSDRITFVVFTFGLSEDQEIAAQMVQAGDVVALIEQGGILADNYRVRSTPSAVVVDTDGAIASAPVGGPDEIEALVRLTVRGSAEPELVRPDGAVHQLV